MEEIDLKELIDMFLRKKLLIIFTVIIFALLGAIYTLKFVVPKYESSTSLILVQTGTELSADSTSNTITTADLTLNSKLVDNYREIATSKTVLNRVIDNLNLDMIYKDLAENVTVTTKTDTEVINIIVKNEDRNEACKIANEIAEVFVEKIEDLFHVKNVIILDPAELANEPCNINLTKNVIIFAFVGAILVFAYILLVNMLDTTLKTDIDIENATGLPVLASIVYRDENQNRKITNASRVSTMLQENEFKANNDALDSENDSKTMSMFSYLNTDIEDDYYTENGENTDEKKGWRR